MLNKFIDKLQKPLLALLATTIFFATPLQTVLAFTTTAEYQTEFEVEEDVIFDENFWYYEEDEKEENYIPEPEISITIDEDETYQNEISIMPMSSQPLQMFWLNNGGSNHLDLNPPNSSPPTFRYRLIFNQEH